MLTGFSIALFYADETAGTWSLRDLAAHRGVIAPEHVGSDGFTDAAGMLAFYHDRFHCFLQVGAGDDVLSYVHFLLESLVSLSRAQLPAAAEKLRPEASFMGHDQVVASLFQSDQTLVLVQDAGDDLTLAYLNPAGEAPEYRLSPYFQHISVAKAAWRAAAIEALDEYFQVANEQAALGKQRPTRLAGVIDLWNQARPALIAEEEAPAD
ncbi:MAG TPA: hypothetical protein VD886_13765 [Herpetosiphonaceae bacterium]|nr:hypothetical protein [Herpetosiphonaceae bacterium]